MQFNTLTPDLFHKIDAYWRAANYLSVGQIYLLDNPLLKRPLVTTDIKHMLLDKDHPRIIRYRSAQPVLTPLLATERYGRVPNVVFPTGIDRRDDLGMPDRFDVYYGMADDRIGVARLDLPEDLLQ